MGTSGLGRAGSNHLGLAPNQTNQIGRAEIKSLLSDPKNDPSTQLPKPVLWSVVQTEGTDRAQRLNLYFLLFPLAYCHLFTSLPVSV
jgi:hypothetical protein